MNEDVYCSILKLRPNMGRIEDEFRIFDRPSANNSLDMKNYIYKLEKFIEEKLNKTL